LTLLLLSYSITLLPLLIKLVGLVIKVSFWFIVRLDFAVSVAVQTRISVFFVFSGAVAFGALFVSHVRLVVIWRATLPVVIGTH
jgi:hypothetical protein